MQKKYFITGATSPLGAIITKMLIDRGDHVKCLLIDDNYGALDKNNCGEVMFGTFSDMDKIAEAIKGYDAIINVAHVKFAPEIIALSSKTGIKRAIFISSQRRFTNFPCPTSKFVIDAEALIEKSNLDYTVLRSAMIYGGVSDNNVSKMISILKKLPFIPLFKNGKNLVQPVYIYDLADAALKALDTPVSIRKMYNMAGAAPITYKEFIKTIADAAGIKVRFIPFPLGLCVGILKIIEKICPFKLPANAEQLQRLAEDKDVDYSETAKDLGYKPKSFKEGIQLRFGRKN